LRVARENVFKGEVNPSRPSLAGATAKMVFFQLNHEFAQIVELICKYGRYHNMTGVIRNIFIKSFFLYLLWLRRNPSLNCAGWRKGITAAF